MSLARTAWRQCSCCHPSGALLGPPWLGLVVPSALAAADASRAAAGGAVCAPSTSPGLGVQLCPCHVPANLLLCHGLCRDACLIQAGWAVLASTRCVPALLARPLLRGCLSLPRAAPREAAPCWGVRRGWERCLSTPQLEQSPGRSPHGMV